MMDNITQQDILSHQWVPSPMWFSFWTSMWGIHADQFSVSKHYIQINEEHWNLFDGIDLRSTAGRILIRDEYLYQYTRLCNLHGSADFLPHGVVLTGSPGVGKSFFAVFGLASQLRDRKTTLFVLADGTVVLFCEAGAFITQKQSSTSITMAPLIRYRGDTPAARFWVFIDASQDFQEPPDDLTNTNAFFPVQCVPPEYSRYKKWIVDGRAAVWIMQPWRMQEFAEGLKLSNLPHDDRSVARFYDICGTSLRDVQAHNTDFSVIERSVENAVKRIKRAFCIGGLISSAFLGEPSVKMGGPSVQSDAHCLFVVNRKTVTNRPTGRMYCSPDDLRYADFKAPLVLRHFMMSSSLDEYTPNLYDNVYAWSGRDVLVNSLAGWSAERIAIAFISPSNVHSASRHTADVLDGFHLMSPRYGDGAQGFAYDNGISDETLHVSATNVALIPRNAHTAEHGRGAAVRTADSKNVAASLPVMVRRTCRVDKVQAIHADDSSIFVPDRVHYNPPFSGFFFDHDHDHHSPAGQTTTVWVIHVAVPAVTQGYLKIRQGYADSVREICEHARTLGLPWPLVKHVLVVPFNGTRPAVWWTLGEDVQHEVFVQYLDLGKFLSLSNRD